MQPLIIAGPSGVGKGTLIATLLRSFSPGSFGFSVSCTSRAPRPGEVEGVHYYFVARQKFLDMVEGKQFLEYADVFGNMYGSPLSEITRIQAEGAVPLLEVDVQGVRQIRENPVGSNATYIFIMPPSMEELAARLRSRGTETEDKLRRRLTVAKDEVAAAAENLFDKVIVNSDLHTAVDELIGYVRKVYPDLPLAASSST